MKNILLLSLLLVSSTNDRINAGECITALQIGAATIQGKKSRQEDRYVARNKCLAVFDGSAGDWLAEYMKSKTEKSLDQKKLNGRQSLELLFQKGETHSQNPNQSETENSNAAGCGPDKCLTTATIALTNNGRLTIGWVGDTRAILVNKQGNIVFETEDHKPSSEFEKSRIEQKRIEIVGNDILDEKATILDRQGNIERCCGVAVSRAIGCNREPGKYFIVMQPDWYEKKLDQNDQCIINACDGFWDVFTSQEAADIVTSKLTEAKKSNKKINVNVLCTELVDQALKKGSADNITVTIMLLGKAEQFWSKKMNFLVGAGSLAIGAIILWIFYHAR